MEKGRETTIQAKNALYSSRRAAQEHHDKPEGLLVLVHEAGLGHRLDEQDADDGEHGHLRHRRDEHRRHGQPRERAGDLDARKARPEQDERERDADPAHKARCAPTRGSASVESSARHGEHHNLPVSIMNARGGRPSGPLKVGPPVADTSTKSALSGWMSAIGSDNASETVTGLSNGASFSRRLAQVRCLESVPSVGMSSVAIPAGSSREWMECTGRSGTPGARDRSEPAMDTARVVLEGAIERMGEGEITLPAGDGGIVAISGAWETVMLRKGDGGMGRDRSGEGGMTSVRLRDRNVPGAVSVGVRGTSTMSASSASFTPSTRSSPTMITRGISIADSGQHSSVSTESLSSTKGVHTLRSSSFWVVFDE